jgi:hypothetical protein
MDGDTGNITNPAPETHDVTPSRGRLLLRRARLLLHPRAAIHAARFAFDMRMLRLRMVEVTREPDPEVRREMVRAMLARTDFDDRPAAVASVRAFLSQVDAWWDEHGPPPPGEALKGGGSGPRGDAG